MKKISVMISLLVCTLLLVFAAEPCFSQAVKEDFSGIRWRTANLNAPADTTKYFACRYHVDGQEAWWRVEVNNTLVSGDWYNWDTKVRREILQYTFADGSKITCVPSDGPPEVFKGGVYGTGIVFGPFSLKPTSADAEGGIWEGMWKVEFKPDGSRFYSADAKGHGGSLEGKSLHISNRDSSWAPPPCPCCPLPPGITSTQCVDGWILTPASVK
jgi:hypothetical protein